MGDATIQSSDCKTDSAFGGQLCSGMASSTGDDLGVGAYVIIAGVAFLVILCGAILYYAWR